jgi:hypothetical protein
MVSEDRYSTRYPRYCRKIFIINFKAIVISKIGHTYAIDEGLAGEQSFLEAVLPISFENFLLDQKTLCYW